MQNDKLKSYLLLHLIVFIAGFTAILGELITIDAISLVWYRMAMAGVLMFIYIKIRKINLKIDRKRLLQFSLAGILIAAHWITFFEAINQSNISITLAMFSTGAFFASLIEPIIYKRGIIWYEIVFGLLVVVGIYFILQNDFHYINGMIIGIISAFLASLFAVINGKLVEKSNASIISFYEFLSGVGFITLYLIITGNGFNQEFFQLPSSDWLYLFLLASVCTAFAFIVSVAIMKDISPFTVVLSYNLEPVYGFILAILFFPESETMSGTFYLGALIILSTVIFNGVLKARKKRKKLSNN